MSAYSFCYYPTDMIPGVPQMGSLPVIGQSNPYLYLTHTSPLTLILGLTLTLTNFGFTPPNNSFFPTWLFYLPPYLSALSSPLFSLVLHLFTFCCDNETNQMPGLHDPPKHPPPKHRSLLHILSPVLCLFFSFFLNKVGCLSLGS